MVHIPQIEAEDSAIEISTNEIKTIHDFNNFLTANFIPLSNAAEAKINSDYEYIVHTGLTDEEIAHTMQWTAINLEIGACFGFPQIGTYFISRLGMEQTTAELNSFDPRKAANIGNYLQHIMVQWYHAINYADRIDRQSPSYFSKAVECELNNNESSNFIDKIRNGYISPKRGTITVAGSGDIGRIRYSRTSTGLKPVDCNWSLICGYQAAEIMPNIFINPHSNYWLILNKIVEVIERANSYQNIKPINLDPGILCSAADKISEYKSYL